MNRTAASMLTIACGLGLLALILVLSVFFDREILARIPSSLVLIVFGVALSLSGAALARSATSAYRPTYGTRRIAHLAFIIIGLVALILGIITIFR